ncbi:MAG: HAMP domain-containing sensor histidine kinase [Rhodospirillales bacterium]
MKFLSKSLSAKFIATITPIFFVVFVSCIILETLHSYEKARDRITQRLDTLAASQSIILAETIAAKNINQLSLMLASIISEPNLIGIAIHDAEGKELDSFGKLDGEDAAFAKSINVNYTVGTDVRRVGTLKLVMTDQYAIQEIKTQLYHHILLGIALLVAALFAAVFSYRIIVVRPLDKMLSAIHETRDGKFGLVAWESEDEIGRLITAYNDMQSRLDAYEHELKGIQEQLEQRVEERTRDLVQARHKAEGANRVKTKFLSSMSHEFRTPMNAILGFTQILQMSPEAKNDPRTLDRLEKIEESAKNLMTLLDDIMAFTQLDRLDEDLVIEPVSPLQAVREAVTLIGPLADSRQISIRIADEADLPPVMGDLMLLTRALLFLLSNAVKYNRTGGTVDIELSRAEGRTRISVSDSGFGIPDDQKENVYEPFNRVGREAGPIQGSGIGLTITRRIIETMGGEIDFDSTEGLGSVFRITLPTAA